MKTLVKLVVVSFLAFAMGIGCGSSGSSDKQDAITLPKDAAGQADTSLVSPPVDAGVDLPVPPGPEVGTETPVSLVLDGGTSGSVCTGLSVDECHLAIINAPTEATVSAQDVTGPVPPAYLTCIAL